MGNGTHLENVEPNLFLCIISIQGFILFLMEEMNAGVESPYETVIRPNLIAYVEFFFDILLSVPIINAINKFLKL